MYDSSDVHDTLSSIYENLASTIEDFQQRGSGWVLDLHLLELNRLRATSYIPLPVHIQNRRAVINIRNNDEKCLLWSVIAGLYFKDSELCNLQRPSRYLEYEKESNLRGYQGYQLKIEKENMISPNLTGDHCALW